MNRTEFLKDTINYYSSDVNRRCVSDRICYYSPEKVDKESISEGCAIGRHLKREDANYIDNIGVMDICKIINDSKLSEKIPEWMKDLGSSFLKDVQLLHDGPGYWNESGLSAQGIDFVKKIQTSWDLSDVLKDTTLLSYE